MKTKLLVILVICFVTISCRTTKQTEKSKAEVKTSANLTVKESEKANLNVQSTFSKVERNFGKEWSTDNSAIDEVSDETTTTTNLSVPDSTGKQYPTSTSTTNKHTHRGEKMNVKKNADSNNSRESKGGVSDNSDYKSDKSVKDKSKQDAKQQTENQITETMKTPLWVFIVIFLLLAAALWYFKK